MARLRDAEFFWREDLKIGSDENQKKLSRVTYHEKLGSYTEKVCPNAKQLRIKS